MQPQGENEYKQLLTDVIKKQIVILGPDITLAKARNVSGLTVADDGTVTVISGEPQQITQSLIDQFVQLSGLIVKKTMEPLLAYHPDENQTAQSSTPQGSAVTPPTPVPTPSPMAAVPQTTLPTTTPSMSMPTPPAIPVSNPTAPTPTPEEHKDQIDAETQKIIDEALKQST